MQRKTIKTCKPYSVISFQILKEERGNKKPVRGRILNKSNKAKKSPKRSDMEMPTDA